MNNPRNNPIYDEIKRAYLDVKDAESNAAAWKAEAADRMKKVNTLIRAAKIVNPNIDRAAYLSALAADFSPAEDTPTESAEATPTESAETAEN